MSFVETASFEVAHGALPWPWVAIDATRSWFAFAKNDRAIVARTLAGEEKTFALPADLALAALHGFAIDPRGELLAVMGASVIVTLDAHGEVRRTAIEEGFTARAVTFDRSGGRLWISAENGKETALILLDAKTHAVIGTVRSAAFPSEANHELHVHLQDDAVLLLAACGEDGTFARVAGWSDGPPVAIETALDQGGASVGFVGFSSDGARVHLAEPDELQTLSWPNLAKLSSATFENDFVANYAGVVIDSLVFVDGDLDLDDAESKDAVMMFDAAARKGSLVTPAPSGMWAGRIGPNAIITVDAKGEPAHARVVVVRKTAN
ncbi:MAG TPA: hypothetical protein VH054_04735 [Polyangiaceae bacterium]|jgi:hypothetical protein|nr:hypothetical protein [Polyangiaceae bacterium]